MNIVKQHQKCVRVFVRLLTVASTLCSLVNGHDNAEVASFKLQNSTVRC